MHAGKLVMWGSSEKPNLQQILDAVKKEFPDRKLSEIFINDHLWLTEKRPMHRDEVPSR